jgi:hypothetical protein
MCQLWDEIKACFNNLEIISYSTPIAGRPGHHFSITVLCFVEGLAKKSELSASVEEKMRLNKEQVEYRSRNSSSPSRVIRSTVNTKQKILNVESQLKFGVLPCLPIGRP